MLETSFMPRQILNSRGMPTVELDIEVGSIRTRTAIPSGASTGVNEALELLDGNIDKWEGKGVTKAIENIVKEIKPALANFSIFDQHGIDEKMIKLDGTPNKSRLGAQAILVVSLGVSRTAARLKGISLHEYLAELYGETNPTLLPIPMMNVVNGGVHANNGLAPQEFMIMPIGAPSFFEAMRWGSETFQSLGKIIDHAGFGAEGGYSPVGFSSQTGRGRIIETLNLLSKGIEMAGYEPGGDISICIDPAASEFYHDGYYWLSKDEKLTSGEMVSFYRELVSNYPIISIEDGMAEDDLEGWSGLMQELGEKIQIMGDDLFVTNPGLYRERSNLANSILIKTNQIGTLTETFQVMRMAQINGHTTIISHRSGETLDTFIADLAVATSAGQIKTGAPCGSERTAKYNQLLRIEKELSHKARFGIHSSII